MSPKRLVLLVEGQGDVEAAPILIARVLQEHEAFDAVFLDGRPLRVGEYSKLQRSDKYTVTRQLDFGEWRRLLRVAAGRPDVGGCVLLLDGDSPAGVAGKPFCAMRAAQLLVAEAKKVGAGKLFSLAVVFACMEFESWLIGGVDSLVGGVFSDGRREIQKLTEPVPGDPESAPRDAKGWFRKVMATGYKPTRDQAELTRLVDLNAVRSRKMRSFRRLESAISGMVAAIRAGTHAVTPAS